MPAMLLLCLQRCLAKGCYRNPHYGVSRLIDPNSKAQYCTEHKSPGGISTVENYSLNVNSRARESAKSSCSSVCYTSYNNRLSNKLCPRIDRLNQYLILILIVDRIILAVAAVTCCTGEYMVSRCFYLTIPANDGGTNAVPGISSLV